jgi:5-methylcytosine-specific restriction endonuclease McrA
MSRAPKVCAHGDCPHLQPCPVHPAKPWSGSGRRERTISGSAQQARARRVLARHRGICHVCGRPGSDEVDHVVPLSPLADPDGVGGDDTDSNLRPIHSKPCHEVKTQTESARARQR